MRTGALLQQLPPGRSLGRKGRKNSSTQPAKAAKKAIAKAPKAIAKAPKAIAKAPKAKAKAPKAKAKAEAPKAKAKRPLPLAPIGSYRDGSPRLLTPRAAKKPRVIRDSSDEEDSSNDSEAADTLEAGRF